MRFLLVNADYPEFTRQLYLRHPGLGERPYREQLALRMDTLFGTADFTSRELAARGHECRDLLLGRGPLQQARARELGLPPPGPAERWSLGRRWRALPWPVKRRSRAWELDLLEAEIRDFRPDVLYVMCVPSVPAERLRRCRDACGHVLGQHAANLPDRDYSGYDLILSSLPNQVDHFRRLGIRSRYFRLAFARRILEEVPPEERREGVVFVGQVGGDHREGHAVLEAVAERTPLSLWGTGAERLAPGSPLRKIHRGPLFGREMLALLGRAAIGLNRHVCWARGHANNMRLYETTGMGALLLTDQGKGLAELFLPGEEILVYRDASECARLVEYHLEHPEEAARIARAGQARTLREHTYAARAEELEKIIEEELG